MQRALWREAPEARPALLLAVACGVGVAAATIAELLLLGRVVGRVVGGRADLSQLHRPLLALLLAMLVRSAGIWLREVSAGRAARLVTAALRRRFLEHLLRLGPAYATGQRTGELIAVAGEGIDRLDAYVARYLPQRLLSVLVPGLVVVTVAFLDLPSALLLLATAPPIPLLMALVGASTQRRVEQQWTGLARLSAHFLETLQGLPTLLLLGRGPAERERVARVSLAFREQTLRVLRLAFLSGLVLEFMTGVAIGLIAVELGVRLLAGGIAFAPAFTILLLAPEFYRPLRELAAHHHAGMEGAAAARQLFQVLETAPAAREPAGARAVPAGPVRVEFREVRLTYAGKAQPALDGVSLTLEAGRRTALVGPTGTGKSSLVHLLLRYLEPSGGRITANGVPLDDLASADWRERVAVVPQRPALFAGSVYENIALARPGATRREVERAAALAGAAGFIADLPRGYDTVVGEGGRRLSGGEAQRLAIARAFLKDAPLLVLDEPTAHLDPATEAQIAGALEQLARGRTVLVIAHRLNTVAGADRVAVLEAGRLVEWGSPAELLRRDGPYRRLVGVGSDAVGGGAIRRGAAGTPAHAWAVSNDKGHCGGCQCRNDTPRTDSGSPEGASSIDPARSGAGGATTSADSRAPSIGALPRLLPLLRGHVGEAALGGALGAATVAAGVGLLAAGAVLLAGAARGTPLVALALPIYLVRLLAVGRAFSRYAERLLSHRLTLTLLAQLRAWLYRRLEPLAPARLLEYRGGDLLARLVGDVAELENLYLRALSPALVALLASALVVALLARLDAAVAAVVAVAALLAGLGLPLALRGPARDASWRAPALRGELHANMAESIQGIGDLAAFRGAARRCLERLAALNAELGRGERRLAAVIGLEEAGQSLLTDLALLAALLLAIPTFGRGRLDGAGLLVLVLLLGGFEALPAVGGALRALDRGATAAARLFDLTDAVPRVREPGRPLPPPAMGGAVPRLAFEGVGFRYPGEGRPAVAGIDLELPPGGRLAVVGPSGAGKSTLAWLAARCWDPDSGAVRLAGRDLRGYALADLRAAVGVAAQQAHLFTGTLRSNLLLARPGATEADLRRVLGQARLAELVGRLPRGLDTWVGEQGLQLSGGERRRLALARTMLRGAPILILDEPTADLDPLTERELLEAVLAGTAGRSLLLITHRLVLLERIDEIVVLDGGRIVERGHHDQLAARGGLYRRLLEAQEQLLTPGTVAADRGDVALVWG